jgi:hypothetical protein
VSPIRQRYIDAGLVRPCPYRNRKKLTLTQMLEQGFWAAAKAFMKREEAEAHV